MDGFEDFDVLCKFGFQLGHGAGLSQLGAYRTRRGILGHLPGARLRVLVDDALQIGFEFVLGGECRLALETGVKGNYSGLGAHLAEQETCPVSTLAPKRENHCAWRKLRRLTA